MSLAYALARAEFIHSITAYQGITTANGAAGGTTLFDSNLIGRNDFITEKAVLLMSGNAQYEDKGAAAFNPVTGQITLQGTGFSAQVVAGTIYRILNISSVEVDVETLLTRLSELRSGYLDDRAPLNLPADIGILLLRLTALRAGYLDELSAANIPDDIDELKSSKDRQLFMMDFWSVPQEEVVVPAGAADLGLPDVVIAGLPAGAAIVRAVAMFKFRIVENINAAANKLAGAQEIQVDDSAVTGWIDAINFIDDMFSIAAGPLRESGDVIIGAIDIAARVDGNDTYSFQWDEAVADLATINFNDVQTGIRIWYSV